MPTCKLYPETPHYANFVLHWGSVYKLTARFVEATLRSIQNRYVDINDQIKNYESIVIECSISIAELCAELDFTQKNLQKYWYVFIIIFTMIIITFVSSNNKCVIILIIIFGLVF